MNYILKYEFSGLKLWYIWFEVFWYIEKCDKKLFKISDCIINLSNRICQIIALSLYRMEDLQYKICNTKIEILIKINRFVKTLEFLDKNYFKCFNLYNFQF